MALGICFSSWFVQDVSGAVPLAVRWNFADFTSKPLGVTRVVITPLNAPDAFGGMIIIRDRRSFVTGSTGSLVVSNIDPRLTYRVQLIGRTTITIFTNAFPPGLTGLVNGADYIVISTNRLSSASMAYSMSASDERYMTNAGGALGGGYVLTLLDTNGTYGWQPAGAGTVSNSASQPIEFNGGLTVRNGLLVSPLFPDLMAAQFSGNILTTGTNLALYFSGDGGGLTNLSGDASKLRNLLGGINLATNYGAAYVASSPPAYGVYGAGDSGANGTYAQCQPTVWTNGTYWLVSNVTATARWVITNSAGDRLYHRNFISSDWIVDAGTPPGPTVFGIIPSATGTNGFMEVYSPWPVVTPLNLGSAYAFVEANGSDQFGRIGGPYPYASVDPLAQPPAAPFQLTNNPTVLIGPGTFSINNSAPCPAGISFIGRGRSLTTLVAGNVHGPYGSTQVIVGHNVTFKELTLRGTLSSYSGAVSNLVLDGVEIDGFSDVFYCALVNGTVLNSTLRSFWDCTINLPSLTLVNSHLYLTPTNNWPGDYNGLHGLRLGANSTYTVSGGSINVPDAATGPGITNACIWIVDPSAVLNLYGVSLNHGLPGSYGLRNDGGSTNINGYYFDNGLLKVVVNGTVTEPVMKESSF